MESEARRRRVARAVCRALEARRAAARRRHALSALLCCGRHLTSSDDESFSDHLSDVQETRNAHEITTAHASKKSFNEDPIKSSRHSSIRGIISKASARESSSGKIPSVSRSLRIPSILTTRAGSSHAHVGSSAAPMRAATPSASSSSDASISADAPRAKKQEARERPLEGRSLRAASPRHVRYIPRRAHYERRRNWRKRKVEEEISGSMKILRHLNNVIKERRPPMKGTSPSTTSPSSTASSSASVSRSSSTTSSRSDSGSRERAVSGRGDAAMSMNSSKEAQVPQGRKKSSTRKIVGGRSRRRKRRRRRSESQNWGSKRKRKRRKPRRRRRHRRTGDYAPISTEYSTTSRIYRGDKFLLHHPHRPWLSKTTRPSNSLEERYRYAQAPPGARDVDAGHPDHPDHHQLLPLLSRYSRPRRRYSRPQWVTRF